MNYKKNIAQAINRELNISIEIIEELIETPSKEERGDFTFQCFKVVKFIKKSPNIIAKELREKLHIEGIEKIESIDAYLNFFIDKNIFIKNVLDRIIIEGDCYGNSKIGEGKCICIDYFSPDIAKSLYIEQLFIIVIGNSICNLFKKYSYTVKKTIKSLTLKEHKEIYSLFNVNFDFVEEELLYNNKMKMLIEELIYKGLVNEFDESKLILLSKYNLPPYIILKDDKLDKYPKVDLAVAIDRKDKYNFYKNIYVTGTGMKTQFKQIFGVLELAGYNWVEDCINAEVGLVKLNYMVEWKRDSNEFILNKIVRAVRDRILYIINIKDLKLDNIDEFVKKIVVGAIIFTCLKNSRIKNILFDFEEMFSFKQGSYLYVQYSYARAINVLKKYSKINIKANLNKLNSKEEFELVKLLEKFNIIINNAIEKLEPSIILVYMVELINKLNSIYNECYIDNIKEDLIMARLYLIKATCQVINNSLELIGMEVLEELYL